MRRHLLIYLILGCATVLTACSREARESKPEAEGLRPEAAHASGSPEAVPANEGLKFTTPPGWISEPPSSSNRQAQYRLPRAKGDPEDAELVVYYFHGGGGTPQANVDRWIGQFTEPGGRPASDAAEVTHKTIHGISLTIVDVSGTYAGSMMPTQKSERPKIHFRMLGAIAEAGNGPWFIKLTGPANTVARWEASFESFLNSAQPSESSQ
jgi:hypothetical protein